MQLIITREEVRQGAEQLPAFPRIIHHILHTLEDDGAGMNELVAYLQRDPVIAGKVIAMANRSLRGGGRREVRDVYTAAAFIGLGKIREIALTTSLADFSRRSRTSPHFWQHSLAVAIAAQEIGSQAGLSEDYAFIAGLLHDVGQLWLAHFYPQAFQRTRLLVEVQGLDTCTAERSVFGLDHGEVGSLLAEYWELPDEIALAVFHHHAAGEAWESKLLAAVHVAEVLSHALDLPSQPDNQVRHLADSATALLGLDWRNDPGMLFGRIEARFGLAQALLQ